MSVQPDKMIVDDALYETEDPADITLLRQPTLAYDLRLRVLPVEEVVPHEHYHGPRVTDLAVRLSKEGKLINPPVVAQQGDKYVVLDGATRLTAFRQLGYPHIVVQVVDLERQRIELTSWNHVLYGGDAAALLATLREVEGLEVVPDDQRESIAPGLPLLPAGALGYLLTTGKGAFVLQAGDSLLGGSSGAWLRVLNAAVETYGQWGHVERTLSGDVDALAHQFPEMAALVVFPRFTLSGILELAAAGRTVPAGITRFVIPGRILRLNAPLEAIVSDAPVATKQAWLDDFVREKLRARQVRYYEEPVVLLDE